MKTLRCLFLASTLLPGVLYHSYAQPVTDADGDVGIGTAAPNPSAALDVSATDKGLLIPRVSTGQRDAILLPATGLMIYNTETESFEYNFGTPAEPEWVRIVSEPYLEEILNGTTWKLSGNTGTTPWDGTSGDMLGTADDTDFVIGTDRTEQVRIYSPSNGGGIGLSGPLRPDGDPGTAGQVLVSQGPGSPPSWENSLTLDALATGDLTVTGTTTFTTLPSFPLAQGNLLVGDVANQAAPLTPGAVGTVLQISGSGVPSWQPVPLLPVGTTPDATLVWDGTNWVENTAIQLDPVSGDATIGGDLVVNGTGATLPTGSVDNSELANSTFSLSYGTGLSGDASVALGGTLNLQNTGVTSVSGTANQVNVSGSSGAVTFSLPQNIDPNATPTFDAVTLDNLPGGSGATEVVVSNGGALESRTLASLIGAASLAQNSLWVGNAGNNPSELGPGAEGQILTIVGGIPTWSAGGAASTDVNTASTTDETFAIRGTASGNTANQVAGVWGRATDPSATNTGTVGVLATGNGNTNPGETNVALQVSDGEFTVGRTTETGTGYTAVEGAAGGVLYSAEGPSGVIEFNLTLANSSPLTGALVGVLNTLGTPLGAPSLGTSLNSALGLSVFNTGITINNRYVTSESIILTQVLDVADTDPLADLLTLFQNGTLTASTLVSNRQGGSFDFAMDIRALGTIPAVNNATIRVGYLVINPAK